MTDLELWKHITQGDKAAFEKLYRRYYSSLLAYALRMQFDECIIKDCIQDLFLKIYYNRYDLPVLTYIKPYLYRSLTNLLFDKAKSIRNSTVPLDELAELIVEDAGLMALFDKNDYERMQAMRLRNALNQLSTKQKNALYFRFIQEFSWEEMAQMFGMSEHSCMNLVGRAISSLRKLMSIHI